MYTKLYFFFTKKLAAALKNVPFVQTTTLIIQKICRAHISTLLGAEGANPETQGQAPFSFTISVLGSFTCITQHMEPTALRPIWRTKQLWLSVLLKDTSAVTGQAVIRTHILESNALDLESNALDRSATTRFDNTVVFQCMVFFTMLLVLK